MITKEQISQLSDPAIYAEAGITPKWRILRTFGDKAELVPYQDSRDVQRILDHVCGPENWANEALSLNGKFYMTISIHTQDGWVSKTDVGTESSIEKTKGEASDAMKRAAVMWGVFRNLYDEDSIVLPVRGKVVLTHNGTALTTPAMISAYCNGLNTSMGKLMSVYKSFEAQFQADKAALAALTTIKNFLTKIEE
jgi:hypothetical protein